MGLRSGLPVLGTTSARDAGSSYSWQTDNYLVALMLRGALCWSATARLDPAAAQPDRRSGSDDPPMAAASTAVVGSVQPNGDGFAFAATTGPATAVVEPLVMASLCDLLYDQPGQPSKQDWTPEQWNAALQQQSSTASWRFLTESIANPQVYFGVAFENAATGQIVIASRGTQTAYDVLVSDLDILREIVPPAFCAAEQFAAQVVQGRPGSGQEILVTGHSLGGADAEYQAARLGLGGTTFAALGVKFAAPGCASDLVNYLYPQDAVANLAPHIGAEAYIQPNGPAQWLDLIATRRFAGEGLHFINNYLEHFGATGVEPITPTQFVEAVLLAEIVDIVSRGDDTAVTELAKAVDDLLGPSAATASFGFDDLAWPAAVAAADLLSAQAGAAGAIDWASAETLYGAGLAMPTDLVQHPPSPPALA